MSTEPKWRYDVYLCYRGQDTRYNFTGNLYNALRQKRIKTFFDDGIGGLKSGDHISSTLFNALEESRISVVVLSEEFALSTWCLEELDKILECRKMKNQIVLPIFYNVDPSDVRKQKRAFGDAMAHHEKRFPREKLQKRRSALHEVGNISGWSFDRYVTSYSFRK